MSGTTYQRSDNINFPSGTDFTASGTVVAPTYQLVKFGSSTTAGQVILAAASTDSIIGVLVNVPTSTNSPSSLATGASPTTAEVHSINAQGTFKVQAGGTIAANAWLTTNGSGYAVTASQTAGGSAPAVRVFGQSIGTGVSGQIIEYQCANFWY